MSTTQRYISVWCSVLRVYQWPKNLVLFAALLFAQELHVPSQAARSVLAFLVFCAASSVTYIFNDLRDIGQDRLHPDKCRRPLASGAVSPFMAMTTCCVLLILAVAGACFLGGPFLAALLGYWLLTTSYTVVLKHAVVIDVLCVASGFVIRAVAGALAINVVFSNWLVVCTFFLALFLVLGKRRRELITLEDGAENHRLVLREYSTDYLDSLIMIVAASTLLSYAIYTCSPEVVERFDTDKLYLTLPFVVYGLFRYLHLAHHREGGGDPSRTLLTDIPIAVTVLCWAVVCVVVIYGKAWL